MTKIITLVAAVELISDGASIIFGGFLGCGSAHHIIATHVVMPPRWDSRA